MRDNNSMASKDYDNMSREELVNVVGGYVHPTTTRNELIVMALLRSDDSDSA